MINGGLTVASKNPVLDVFFSGAVGSTRVFNDCLPVVFVNLEGCHGFSDEGWLSCFFLHEPSHDLKSIEIDQ